MKQHKCPLCKGVGKISVDDKESINRKAAKVMRSSGFTLREIQNVLKYKSVSSVVFLLK